MGFEPPTQYVAGCLKPRTPDRDQRKFLVCGRLMCRWIGTKKFVRFLLQVTATRVRTVRVTA
jgi:hypothetical protein